jgi:UDP-GlcNAc:undecaprenyl-phosphate/decaprenyl-phosphate GlcNAc-1-phosphate transferase
MNGAGEASMLALAGVGLFAASCALSLALGWRIRHWWPGYLSDYPGGMLHHRVSVPLGGGFVFWFSSTAVFLAVAAGCVWGRAWLPGVIVRYVDGLWYRSGELAAILGVGSLVLAAGLGADLFELGWRPRLVLQVMAGVALVVLGTRVTLFWPFSIPVVGGVVTVVWVVGLMTAFAFLDNLDGLATGVGLIASLLFAATQAQAGSLFAPAALLIVAGGLAGVWPYNRYPARLFLGTSGAWLIGFLLAALTVAGTYYRYGMGDSRNSVLSPLLVMAVPCYESAVVFLIWLGERDQPFLNNPRHFSYRWQGVGLSPRQSVGLLLLVSLGAGLGSLLLRRLDAFGTVVLLSQTACLIGVIALVEVSAIRRGNATRAALPDAAPQPVVLSNATQP